MNKFTTFIAVVVIEMFSQVSANTVVSIPIGVILDFGDPVGKIAPICMQMALSEFYETHSSYSTRLLLSFKHSSGDPVNAASAALELIGNDGVHAIVGPQTSAEALFIAEVGSRAHVPILSFTATNPSLSPTKSPFFIRTAPGDNVQAEPIAALIQLYGWHQAVPIFEDSDYSTGFIPFLVDALDAVGTTVPYRSKIPVTASNDWIAEELYKIQTMQTRVFIVHMSISLAGKFIWLADQLGMMESGYVWIVTAGITSQLSSLESMNVSNSLHGVLGLLPYTPRTTQYREFRNKFKIHFMASFPDSDLLEPSMFGIWAYDTVWALAIAVEKLGLQELVNDNAKRSSSTELTTSLVVRKTGEELLDKILTTTFESFGNRFELFAGERNVSEFQILNIAGENEREVGVWSPRYGVTRKRVTGSNVSSRSNTLLPVIWPGESKVVPKGWQMPTSEKRLKIAVPGPVEGGFHSILKTETNPVTNEVEATGFVIEVFEAAIKRLPYAVPFEYVLHVDGNGDSAGDYNELIKNVYSGKYDAVVGDTTITANRSMYVDFTLQFINAGVSMVVPSKDTHSKNAWIFINPLSRGLWLASFAFFVLIGLVVWIIENEEDNQDFQGSPTDQIGSVFYFTFSTLVFSHKAGLESNLSRIVVIVWVFVVLILQTSYTASLTSILTVRQLEPVVSDIKELLSRKEYVGYLQNSFVKYLLIEQGFDPSKLRPYRSPEQYAEALRKGSKNGGVTAIVDEIPYLKVFLKNHCDNYTMVPQTFKTAGFGFVFPKGSPLTADLSRAILNLTESDEMSEIEKKGFGDQSDCLNDTIVKAYSLEFSCFWGLFVITGLVYTIAFILHWILFFYRNRHDLKRTPRGSILEKIRYICELADKIDPSCPDSRNTEEQQMNQVQELHGGPELPEFASSQDHELQSSDQVILV